MKALLLAFPGILALTLLQDDSPSAPGSAVQLSSSCARCHSNTETADAMRDLQGRSIAPFDLWQSTMMANSARDPLWRAAVSAEVAATPSARVEIESTCLRCHAPMAEKIGLEEHGTGSLMHVLDCESEIGGYARDGVSCTICHGISPEGLGEASSYSARFELDPQRRIFGPHEAPFEMPMQRTTGFTPTQSGHVTQSALCGSCHTLETEALDPLGKPTGHTLIEQAPYLEWLNSDFNNTVAQPGPLAATCQECHAPTSDVDGNEIQTRIVRNPMGGLFPPTRPRDPYGRHLFVGGNTLVLQMLKDHAAELNVQASQEALQATIDATREQLQKRTTRLSIGDVKPSPQGLSFHVDVLNLTGHKFPTAHPTRRAWLRVLVRDAKGQVVFASGATDERGRVLGANGKVLPSELANGPVDAHQNRIQSADQVASFYALMADAEGRPTHTLMRGASWMRDDRLLPLGWSSEAPGAEQTEPRGIGDDMDFLPGKDRVHFDLQLAQAGPYSLEVSMLYQTLSARWAAEIMKWKTPDTERFRKLYEQADLRPEVISSVRWN